MSNISIFYWYYYLNPLRS